MLNPIFSKKVQGQKTRFKNVWKMAAILFRTQYNSNVYIALKFDRRIGSVKCLYCIESIVKTIVLFTTNRKFPWWILGLQIEFVTWWRHQMETFSVSLSICAGNSPVTGEFPSQRPVTRSFEVFFDLCLNKRLIKQSRRWWFETPSRPLWRHCNEENSKR